MSLFDVQWFEVSGGCSVWWNYWPPLFSWYTCLCKLSTLYVYKTHV
jgi:hypothetical protein